MNVLIVNVDSEFAARAQKGISRIPKIHIVQIAADFQSGFHKALSDVFDLILIDISLDDEFDGIELCRCIRRSNRSLPVIMTSATTSVRHLELAFEAGVNDFVTKPFRLRELELRVCSWLRLHEQNLAPQELRYEELSYTADVGVFRFGNKRLRLSKRQKALLFLFLQKPEEVLPEQYIRAKLWGDYPETATRRNIRSNVSLLRQALPPDCANWLRTVKGRGYLFQKSGLFHRDHFTLQNRATP